MFFLEFHNPSCLYPPPLLLPLPPRPVSLTRTELSHPVIVDMDWVHVAYDSVRCSAALNTAMSLLVLRPNECLLASQEGR